MRLKFNDKVKLLPTWAYEQTNASPVWGGPYGYIHGTVLKAVTGDHDPKNHVAQIKWGNGTLNAFPEAALEVITNDELDISLDDQCAKGGPLDRDVWCLIKTHLGNWGLGVVEVFPFGTKEQTARYVSAVSRMAFGELDASDYRTASEFLGQPDYREFRSTKLFEAASFIFKEWGLPDMGHLPLPLPEFSSLKAAANSAPANMEAGATFFHLPRNLIDYSDYPQGAAS